MKTPIRLLGLVLLVAVGCPTLAADDATHWKDLPYTEDGADNCLRCHDETSDYPVLDIFKTRHGHPADPDSPFGEQLQCESCHGPGGEHGKRIRRNQERPPVAVMGKAALATTEEANEVCLGCHQKQQLHGWDGSQHESGDLACSDCHQIHAVEDRMLDKVVQSEACLDCHQTQRADTLRASTHPIRFGEMACSNCHAPHGSMGEQELTHNTVRDTCTSCHAEVRGPFLWEHEPVAEDCGLCHNPHGSNHPDLLKVRQPLLCQQCHSRVEHPGLAFTSDTLPGRDSFLSAFSLAQGCANCHSQVHGSNHPSGTSLTR